MRRAKIICTLGPATRSPERVRALIDAGMDVARLNLSHGAHSDHEEVNRLVRTASDDSGHGVGVLVDLQGPKIRLGAFSGGPVLLQPGSQFTITTEDVDGDADIAATTYQGLPADVRAVTGSWSTTAGSPCRPSGSRGHGSSPHVVEGGVVSDHKGINLPGVAVSVPALSDKDVDDLRWALHLRADLVALSLCAAPPTPCIPADAGRGLRRRKRRSRRR
jgi:pyruvate kinase